MHGSKRIAIMKRNLQHFDKKYVLLSTLPTHDDQKIRGTKLPTYKQVILSFLAFEEEFEAKNLSKKKLLSTYAANETVQDVLTFY